MGLCRERIQPFAWWRLRSTASSLANLAAYVER